MMSSQSRKSHSDESMINSSYEDMKERSTTGANLDFYNEPPFGIY